jgi:hypothetical protein
VNVTEVVAHAFRVVKLSRDSTLDRYGVGNPETSVIVALVEPAGGVNHAEPVAGSLKVTAAVNVPGQLGLVPPPRTIVPLAKTGGPFVPRAEDIAVEVSVVLSCPSFDMITQLVSRKGTAINIAIAASRFRVLFISFLFLVISPASLACNTPNNDRWSNGREAKPDNLPVSKSVKRKNRLLSNGVLKMRSDACGYFAFQISVASVTLDLVHPFGSES